MVLISSNASAVP